MQTHQTCAESKHYASVILRIIGEKFVRIMLGLRTSTIKNYWQPE